MEHFPFQRHKGRKKTQESSLNNQFFETQHKNKLDECVKAGVEGVGMAEKRWQVGWKIFLHGRRASRGKKLI